MSDYAAELRSIANELQARRTFHSRPLIDLTQRLLAVADALEKEQTVSVCQSCGGKGGEFTTNFDSSWTECSRCSGSGQVQYVKAIEPSPCSRCKGTGRVRHPQASQSLRCPDCQKSGVAANR